MVLVREREYFAGHAHRRDFRTTYRKGCHIGSGAVESACRQRQCRLKRPGQFWTSTGMRNQGALTEARHNLHWEEMWSRPFTDALAKSVRLSVRFDVAGAATAHQSGLVHRAKRSAIFWWHSGRSLASRDSNIRI